MKAPLAVVAAVAAAVIAAAVPTSRSEAYPGAGCFDNCNAAYGMCEYRSHTPNAECRRLRFKNRGMAIPRSPTRSDGVRIPSKSATPYSLRVR